MSPPLPSTSSPVIVGHGAFRYRVAADWPQLPGGWSFVEVVGVATDGDGNVLVLNRGEHPVIVFDRAGKFLRAWGEGLFNRAHGITMGPDQNVWCVDDAGHTARKFTLDGQLLFTLGTGHPSDTGAVGFDYRTIQRAAGPFNYPTNIAFGPAGHIYVSDGYSNARVHRFSADCEWQFSWGTPGGKPGEFHVPHGIAIDSMGRVIVADRENSRLQRFTADGEFIDAWPAARPCQIALDGDDKIFVAELGYRAGMFPGNVAGPDQTTGGRFSILNREGVLQTQFGGGDEPCAPGDFFAPHDVCLDPWGDLYVSEVVYSAGGNRDLVPTTCHTLQKFIRLSDQEAS